MSLKLSFVNGEDLEHSACQLYINVTVRVTQLCLLWKLYSELRIHCSDLGDLVIISQGAFHVEGLSKIRLHPMRRLIFNLYAVSFCNTKCKTYASRHSGAMV